MSKWVALAEQGDWPSLVEQLLVHYDTSCESFFQVIFVSYLSSVLPVAVSLKFVDWLRKFFVWWPSLRSPLFPSLAYPDAKSSRENYALLGRDPLQISVRGASHSDFDAAAMELLRLVGGGNSK